MSYQDPEPVDPYASPEAKDPASWPPPLSQDERTWGMLCHLSAFAGYVFPFGGIVGPLVVWLIKKDEMPFVDDQGKEALNFQISVLIYAIVSFVLIFVLIGIILLCVILVLIEIYQNVAPEIGLVLLNDYVI